MSSPSPGFLAGCPWNKPRSAMQAAGLTGQFYLVGCPSCVSQDVGIEIPDFLGSFQAFAVDRSYMYINI